ncbi:MAG TPA: UDP-N-acetylglucosamine 2-epimerase (non-hydrolyzing) [Polyangiaceae bacterium]|nr:UDP-N-acetylglucosamine 2-epimerase (non-hydrolyzing) [Polyangiaceae bacterium]
MSDAAPILVCAGTRPEVIKLFPVWRALRAAQPGRPTRTVGVRQQAALLDQTFATLGERADISLERPTGGFDLREMLAGLLLSLGNLIEQQRPAAVIVQGDTTTALAAALAGFYARVPVVHVEAGLRTWTFDQPFPEEMHRAVIDQFAALCLAPTPMSAENLTRMGVPSERIHVTGNTVVDALQYVAKHLPAEQPRPVPAGKRRVLVTCHRRENFEAGIQEICDAVLQLVTARPDLDFVVTRHPNPNVAQYIDQSLVGRASITVLEPLPYRDFVHLMRDAWLILTDSGGIQEEATALGKPFLILREGTERPEAIGAGMLVGAAASAIVQAVLKLEEDTAQYAAMARPRDVFGDGRAGERSAELIGRLIG